MEREAGGVGFTIDHYIPKSSAEGKPLEHTFLNLLWSCGDCNSYKGTYRPNETARDRGLVVIRPDTMVPSDHMELDEETPLELLPKTTTGDFTIARLDLNRPGLQRIRSARFQIDGARRYVSEGVSALSRTALDQLSPSARGPYIKLRELVLSKAAGQLPTGELRRQRVAAEIEALKSHPAVKAVLDAFPDARIEDVRKLVQDRSDDSATG